MKPHPRYSPCDSWKRQDSNPVLKKSIWLGYSFVTDPSPQGFYSLSMSFCDRVYKVFWVVDLLTLITKSFQSLISRPWIRHYSCFWFHPLIRVLMWQRYDLECWEVLLLESHSSQSIVLSSLGPNNPSLPFQRETLILAGCTHLSICSLKIDKSIGEIGFSSISWFTGSILLNK